MVASVDEQLILEMLRRVKVFAWRLVTITPALDTVVAGGDSSVLHLDVGRRVCELAFRVGTRTLVPLKLSTHFQLQPSRVLSVE